MKHIVFLTNGLKFGGAERVLVSVANDFATQGYRATILCLADSTSVYPLHPQVNIICLKNVSSIYSAFGKLSRLYLLRREIKRLDPDCVVVFQNAFTAYTNLALAGTKYPVIGCERNDPHIYFCKRKFPNNTFYKFLFERCDGFVFQTEDARAFFPKKVQDRSAVISNPVWVTDEQLASLPDCDREPFILAVGRLAPQKNYPMLIRAFSSIAGRFPDHTLVIHGTGVEHDALIKLIDELGLSGRVELRAPVSDIMPVYRRASLFVLASQHEGMPNVLMEAMACETPCIATDCPAGGPAFLINPGENGLLVPVGDEAALAQAMEQMLADWAGAQQIGRRAGEIRERLSPEKVFRQWRDYILPFAEKRIK
ncbi:MAG: glycosyltransferase family 4 protein [Clostridiales bacterium]|nr:glycosyltransferase family 4 protein [Clostridiales bacterium]